MLDFSRDHLIIDDPVTVGLRKKTAPGLHAAPVDVGSCQKNQEAAAAADDTTDLRQRTTVFHLFRTPLTAAGVAGHPSRGDLLVHGGREYLIDTVQDCDRDAQGPQRYRCTTVEAS